MGMVGDIAKGAVHTRVDPLVKNAAKRHDFIEALRDPQQSYLDILRAFTDITAGELEYLREYWYDPNWTHPNSECWWKAHQPIEPIIRQSLIKAFELAIQKDLPLDSYWICVGNKFEVFITCSEHQITRIISSPPVPAEELKRQRERVIAAKMAQYAKEPLIDPVRVVRCGRAEAWEDQESADATTQVVIVKLKDLTETQGGLYKN